MTPASRSGARIILQPTAFARWLNGKLCAAFSGRILFKLFERRRGSPRALEEELRAKGGRLRTLIKAGGLWYPSVNSNTSSHFKVDRKHNKLSLVSMFGPSPDWVVGVSGLNLCRKDCSWESSMDIDLYPWDSGTDNGISYMSPNAETQPRERMHKITTKYPEDPRAPFYNPRSDVMTPLAKLFIRREKVIARNCDDEILQSQIVDVAENDDDANNIRKFRCISNLKFLKAPS